MALAKPNLNDVVDGVVAVVVSAGIPVNLNSLDGSLFAVVVDEKSMILFFSLGALNVCSELFSLWPFK